MRTLSLLLVWFTASLSLCAQTLNGKWEVTGYAEQGIQVDKTAPGLAQAIKVYQYVQMERARTWYGYDEMYEDRKSRSYRTWAERDSVAEVTRLSRVISLPYFAVFFPDSTLSTYNLDPVSKVAEQAQVWKWVFDPGTMSLDLHLGSYEVWQVQVIELTADRLRLFIPQEAEVVTLVRREMSLP